jgi:tripartite-type tricarboxylate transporter receptor subunit TctC
VRTARIALVFATGVSIAAGALAQSYPTKSVRVIIPNSPGSGLDIVGRWVSQKLSETWGQPVVVDNRPGAGGTLGTGIVARSPTDGYTLLVAASNHAVNLALYNNLPYDTFKDFLEIAPLAALYEALVVSPSAGVKNVSELIAAAKARPGQLTFASAGMGGATHFSGEKFRLAAGIDVVHVPYKGGPEGMTDVMMGRVTYYLPPIGTALPFIKAGKLVALGVSGRQRSALLPEVPTIAEAGVANFEDMLWFGMWVPARVPAWIVDKLAKDTSRALAAPDLREQFRSLAAEPMSMTRTEFARFVRSEAEAAARVAKAAGIKPQ